MGDVGCGMWGQLMEQGDSANIGREAAFAFGFPAKSIVFSLPSIEMFVFVVALGRRALDVLWGLTLTSLVAAFVWPVIIAVWFRWRKRRGRNLGGWSVKHAWMWAFVTHVFIAALVFFSMFMFAMG